MTEQLFDNILYKSNPLNTNFDDLPFDGDERLISRWWIYHTHNDIVESLNNGSRIYIKMNWM